MNSDAVRALLVALVISAPVCAQTSPSAPPTWHEDAASPVVPSSITRADIKAAIDARQWDRAETLLAAEIEKLPAGAGAGGGVQAAELLKTLANIFLIDRKPLNAAVAIKKAEALGPLDEQTRFALAIAYISLQRGDWARPELDRLAAAQPSNVTYQYWLARLDYDAGKYASAIQRLEDVVTRDPQFVRAFDNLGLCYEAQNQPEKAIPRYREAVRLTRAAPADSRSAWPLLNLGSLLRRRGELVEAESLLKEAVQYQRAAAGTRGAQAQGQTPAQRQGPGPAQQDRDLAHASYELGVLLEQRGRWNEALGALAGAVQADPTYPEPHYVLARLYRRGNRPDQADDALATFKRLRAASYLNRGRAYQEQAADDPEAARKAIDVYRELLVVDPTNLEGLYQSAFLLALQGKFADSRTMIDRMPEETRDRPQALAVLTVDLLGLGGAAADAGAVAGAGTKAGAKASANTGALAATANATAARLAAHPDLTAADVLSVLPAFAHMPPASLGAADAIAQQWLQTLATRRLASAEAMQRASVPLLMDLARAAYRGGAPKAALGYLAHARDLDPRNAGVHFFFGMACIDLNLGAEAYESLKKAVALDPENAFINYALGAVSIQRHDSSEALPYFEKYVQLKPDDPRGRFALGAARFYSNQLDAARTDLQQAAAHPATAAGAHFFLGRIARQLNDLDTARAELDLALRASPRYADAWAELGLVQTRTADYADAERSLTKALAIDPHHYAATFNLSTLYSKTKDPRRTAQAARLAALQEQRAAQAQEFLRIIEVSPASRNPAVP